MYTTGSEHWNLEFRTNGWPTPWFRADGGHQVDVGRNVTFRLSGESLDTPYNGLLFRFILGTAKRMFDFSLGSIFGHWDLDDDMSCKQLIREVCHYFEID